MLILLIVTRSTSSKRSTRAAGSGCNIRFPLISFRPESFYYSIILPIRSKPKSIFLRYQLVNIILKTSSTAIRVYLNCERTGQADKYKVGVSASRYIEYA